MTKEIYPKPHHESIFVTDPYPFSKERLPTMMAFFDKKLKFAEALMSACIRAMGLRELFDVLSAGICNLTLYMPSADGNLFPPT